MPRFGFATLATVALADSDIRELFKQWKAEHNQVFNGDEDEHRFQVFKSTHEKIQEENSKGHSFTLAHNFMSAMTQQERVQLLGFHPMRANNASTHLFAPASEAPDAVDWTTEGKVTPVKNQGQCGSCWAFSAVEALESRWAIHEGKPPVAMSEQELVDCDTASDAGCNGGLPENAFEFLETHDMCTEASYAYAGKGGQCHIDGCDVAVPKGSVTGVGKVPADDDAAMAAAVAEGPVSVGIEADQFAFQMYSSGILKGNCGTNLDHGVVVVGYGTDYFKVRNSWGSSWGENGYIRIGRGVAPHGECGILMDGSYPTFASQSQNEPVDANGHIFLEGFLEGFIGEATHIKKCIVQSEQLAKDAAGLLADLKAHKFNNTIHDIEALVQDVGSELPSCKGAGEDLKPIFEAFKGVRSIKELVQKLKSNFLAHDREFLDILEDEVQVCTFGAPDAHKCGEDLGKQVRSLMVGDQFSSPMVTGHGKVFMAGFLEGFLGKAEHIKACIADSEKTEQAVVKFIADLKAHKFNQTIADVQAVISDVTEDLSACKDAGKDLTPILTAFKDVHSIKDLVKKIKENFLAHDKEFLDILDDMIEVCTFGAPDAHKCGEDLGKQARSLVIGDQFAIVV
jgi:C1A family cysteine protease